jgi:hypothetical protein
MTSTEIEAAGAYGDLYGGLEDFTVSDMKLARVTIEHADGVFKDSLTGETFKEIFFIPLALIKQRVLWHPTVTDDSQPLCKATNFELGFPTVGQPKDVQNFPWGAAKLNPADFPASPEFGRPVVPCSSCVLKDWGSDPVGGKKPWCTEQHSIPVLYGATSDDCINMAVMTFQRSSMQASKAFFASIMRARKPAFSVIGKATLLAQKRGTNTFHVPVLAKFTDTEMSTWGAFSEQAKTIADYLREPPLLKMDGAPDVSGIAAATTWTPGVAAPVAVTPTVVTAPPGATIAGAVVTTAPVAVPATPAPAMMAPIATPAGGRDGNDDLPF